MTDNIDNNETLEQKSTETTDNEKKSGFDRDILIRIFMTLVFSLICWLSLFVFGAVVLVQVGFLVVTRKANENLKSFSKQIVKYVKEMLAYISFQNDNKPFPFKSWGENNTDQQTAS